MPTPSFLFLSVHWIPTKPRSSRWFLGGQTAGMPSGLVTGQITQPRDIMKTVPQDNSPNTSLDRQGTETLRWREVSAQPIATRWFTHLCSHIDGVRVTLRRVRLVSSGSHITEPLPFSSHFGSLIRQLLFVMATAVLVSKTLVLREALIPRALADHRSWHPGLLGARVCLLKQGLKNCTEYDMARISCAVS